MQISDWRIGAGSSAGADDRGGDAARSGRPCCRGPDARHAPAVTPPVVSNRSSNMMRQGLPLPQIVAGLQAMEPYRSMRYIGIERFDPRTGIYSLRFLNGRQIIVVYVDSRSGRILNRGF